MGAKFLAVLGAAGVIASFLGAGFLGAAVLITGVLITEADAAETYRTTQTVSVLDAPNGRVIDKFAAGEKFTSDENNGSFVRVSGYFPNGGKWRKNERAWWAADKFLQNITPPALLARAKGVKRALMVDKKHFTLTVFDTIGSEKTVVFAARVGLGMDECLAADEGGKCYFTEAGEYKVEFKVFDPDGIKWCIPQSMEKEARYAESVARGERCFRGSLGNFALNIGKTYAIHGTSNPKSIGKRSSHGCIRVKNSDAEMLYKLMKEGDQVIIGE